MQVGSEFGTLCLIFPEGLRMSVEVAKNLLDGLPGQGLLGVPKGIYPIPGVRLDTLIQALVPMEKTLRYKTR